MSTMETQTIPFGEQQPAIRRMFDIAEVAKLTPQEAERYNISFETWLSNRDAVNTAKDEGRAEGMAAGKAEIALKMLQRGDSASDIASLTGLTEAEIARLRPMGTA